MASLSSSSVSSSNSLGNTSLRGFGGMASGIDRDAIIEQMTQSTNLKIENQKSNMTKLQWKQEAYRGITDKILNLTDKYASYSSTSNLKDPYLFSKSLITVHGAESATRFVTATGTSNLVQNVAITAVKRLATATVRQSNAHISQGGLKTTLGNEFSGDVGEESFSYPSTIKGRQITIGILETDLQGKSTLSKSATFTLPETYKDDTDTDQPIEYTPEKGKEPDEAFYNKLVSQLNKALGDSEQTISINEDTTKKLSELIEFQYDENSNQMKIVEKSGGSGGYTFGISQNSSALKGVGVNADKPIKLSDGVSFSADRVVTKQTTIDYLTDKSLIFEYDGIQKNVSLLTSEDAAYLKNNENFKDKDGNVLSGEALANAKLKEMKSRLQGRLDTAFGKDAIKVNIGDVDEKGNEKALAFDTTNSTSSVNILSKDDTLLKQLGLEFGASNKVNIDGKLGQAALGLNPDDYTKANGQLDLKINGVSITGLTANSTISDILSKINSTTAAGVKATYVEATGKFMLVSNETGQGREISLDSILADKLFGGYNYKTNDQGELFDENGAVLAKKNDEGKYIVVEGHEFAGKEIDGNGNIKGVSSFKDEDGNIKNVEYFIAADGKTMVNEAGYKIDSHGRLIDKSGFFTDKSGNLLDKNGKKVAIVDENGELVNSSEYEIDSEGDFISKATGKKLGSVGDTSGYSVKRINSDGHFVEDVDGKEVLVDIEGKRVDKKGYFVDEEGYYFNKDGTRVDMEGYELDEKGNYIGKDGTLVRNFGGEWYRVNKDGYVVGKIETETDDGKTEQFVTNIGGTWYKAADEKGDLPTDADGNPVYEKVEVPKNFDPMKGERKAALDDKPVLSDKKQGVGSTVKTGGTVYEGLYRVGGFTENIDEGQNAKIQVSYGNGVTVDIERSSNTFNLEGLTVTVSGTFGGSYDGKVDKDEYLVDKNGNWLDENGQVTTDESKRVKATWESDSSQTVTFSAKADVDKALENVKAFFEDFNALVTEINGQIKARPDSSYGPLTSAQKDEMDETSIENWEKKAKQGILFGDDVMRDLSGSMEGILSNLMSKYGVNYQDLEKIGITYSEDYLDGGTLVFDESKFRSAMESDPDLVSKLISGGENGGKGLIHAVEDAVTPYATRYASKNGNSYGRLIEVAGTEEKPSTLMSNQIYKQLKEMQETIDKLQSQLKVEQDRYISQFTTMETLLNQMNTQSSYLSQLTA